MLKKQEIITIDSSDSSSEEDDESDKKQAWVDKTPKDMNSYDDNRSALFGDSGSEDEESIQKQGKRPNRLTRGIDPQKTNFKTKRREAHDDDGSSSSCSGNNSLGTQEDVLKHSEAASSTLLESISKARQGKSMSKGSQSSQAQSSEISHEESNSMKRATTPKKLQLYTKRNEVLLHGFVRSIEEKEPHQAIRIVQKVLGNATTCKKGSSELHESLIDANMMLQESLYNINDRTHFVKAPSHSNVDTSGSQKDDNKRHIIRLAKKFGLIQPQIGTVLDHSAPDEESDSDGAGYFSIDKAVEKIMELKDSGNSELESDPEEDNVVATMPPPEGATVLGSRIKTVFEDGKEYEGTITDIHYRVAYDDGDIETMCPAEVFEKLACNESFLDTGNDFKCKALELFSGCSLLSTLCRRKGMDTISVDNDINSNASVKADFTSAYVESLISSQTFDFIHASPVCRTYSRLAGGVHRTKDNYNKSSDSHQADAMLLQLYFVLVEALKKNNDATITIENPSTGLMKHSRIISLLETEHGFKRYDIFYCQFGRAEQKPTSIWTNDEALGSILLLIGGKCKCVGRHEEGVKVNNDKNFSALPIKLCQIISDYLQSKHQSLKFKRFASKCNEEETDEQV